MFHSVSLGKGHVTPIKSHTSQTKFPRFLQLEPVLSLRAGVKTEEDRDDRGSLRGYAKFLGEAL